MVNVKLPKTVKLKTYVATTLVLAVLLLASVGYVLTSNGTTVTITPQSYIETASYVIEKIGNTYYAKNGTTGEIEFSGTNAATAIQSTLDNTPSYGSIFIKASDQPYILDASLEVPGDKKINIYSDWATLQAPSGDFAIKVLYTQDSEYAKKVISGLKIDGNNHAGSGIQIYPQNVGIILRDLYFIDCDTAIETKYASETVYWIGPISMENIYVRRGYKGINFEGVAHTAYFERLLIVLSQPNGYCFRLGGAQGTLSHAVFNSVHFETSVDNVTLLDLQSGIKYATFTNFKIESFVNSPNNVTGIVLNHDDIDITFINPVIGHPEKFTTIIQHSAGKWRTLGISESSDFRTQNSGTATISSGTTVTFTHGLAGTPDVVLVGWQDTGYGTWSWSANSTHITVTVTNSGTYDFSWYAEYKP